MSSAFDLRGFDAVFYKEIRQIARSPAAFLLTVALPMIQMLLLGYAINTTVEHVPAAIFFGDRGSGARAFAEAIEGSRTFDVVVVAASRAALHEAVTAGRARVAFDIPENFTADVIAGHRPAIGVLVDGSDSAIAQVAYGAAGAFAGIALRDVTTVRPPAFEVRPLVLFNPSMRSADFFVPGLIGLVMQNITVLLTSLAIVGEREKGTLEQLLVTPIGAAGLMLGKLIPYAIVAGFDFTSLLLVMRFVFGVPIAGSVPLLMALSSGFLLTALGLGLLISTIARSQMEASLLSIFILLPSVLLSGTIFERSLMPPVMQAVSYVIPLSYYVEILRGIVLRGAGLPELWPFAVPLFAYGLAIFATASVRFARSTR